MPIFPNFNPFYRTSFLSGNNTNNPDNITNDANKTNSLNANGLPAVDPNIIFLSYLSMMFSPLAQQGQNFFQQFFQSMLQNSNANTSSNSNSTTNSTNPSGAPFSTGLTNYKNQVKTILSSAQNELPKATTTAQKNTIITNATNQLKSITRDYVKQYGGNTANKNALKAVYDTTLNILKGLQNNTTGGSNTTTTNTGNNNGLTAQETQALNNYKDNLSSIVAEADKIKKATNLSNESKVEQLKEKAKELKAERDAFIKANPKLADKADTAYYQKNQLITDSIGELSTPPTQEELEAQAVDTYRGDLAQEEYRADKIAKGSGSIDSKKQQLEEKRKAAEAEMNRLKAKYPNAASELKGHYDGFANHIANLQANLGKIAGDAEVSKFEGDLATSKGKMETLKKDATQSAASRIALLNKELLDRDNDRKALVNKFPNAETKINGLFASYEAAIKGFIGEVDGSNGLPADAKAYTEGLAGKRSAMEAVFTSTTLTLQQKQQQLQADLSAKQDEYKGWIAKYPTQKDTIKGFFDVYESSMNYWIGQIALQLQGQQSPDVTKFGDDLITASSVTALGIKNDASKTKEQRAKDIQGLIDDQKSIRDGLIAKYPAETAKINSLFNTFEGLLKEMITSLA